MQESKGKRALHPLQERHTQCDELSSYRSRALCQPSHPKVGKGSRLSGINLQSVCKAITPEPQAKKLQKGDGSALLLLLD